MPGKPARFDCRLLERIQRREGDAANVILTAVGQISASSSAVEGAAIVAEAAARAGLERDEAERTTWNGIRRSFRHA
jgi:hypothetical protein